MDDNAENQDWKPTREDVVNYIKREGWPTFDGLTYDHLKTDDERTILQTAVDAARRFVDVVKNEEKPAALIVLAGGVDGDMDRTGYGCGKTTLAKIIYYAASNVQYIVGGPTFWVMPVGRFYSSRDLMGIFDADAEKLARHTKAFGRLLVIDDVGREGTLRWERRDPEMQLEEKRDRYYTIINYCYEQGISLVITSNMSSRELAAFLGGASWSRLLQMARTEFRVNMTGLLDMRPLLVDEWGGQVDATSRPGLVIR